jgi:DNA polymerase-3 subunit epsilon
MAGEAPQTSRLRLTRPIVSFDLETTGLDIASDRVVEICCVKLHTDGRREVRTQRLNPGRPIAPQATAVHGITDADVAHAPRFEQAAAELHAFFVGCDLTGFNIEHFDLPAAHHAEADALAAADVLLAQVDRYDDLPASVDGLHTVCRPPEWLDGQGKIVWADDDAVISFGRHKGKSLRNLAENDASYLQWICRGNFAPDTIDIVKAALNGIFPTKARPAPPTSQTTEDRSPTIDSRSPMAEGRASPAATVVGQLGLFRAAT